MITSYFCCKFFNETIISFINSHLYNYISGGRQFKVTVNDTITIFKIPAELGERIKLEKVQH